MKPIFFENAELFLDNCIENNRSQYLLPDSAIKACQLAIQYRVYIKWYECGILHERDGKKCYEGHDTWTSNFSKNISIKNAHENNLQALKAIVEDIEDGYSVFCMKVERLI